VNAKPLADARRALAEGRFGAAQALAAAHTAAAPEDGEAWLLCGLAGLLDGAPLEATARALERARVLLERDPRPLAALGEIALRRDDPAGAEPLLAEAVRRAPRWAEPAAKLGDARLALARAAEAAPAYLRAAHGEPPHPAARARLLACAQQLAAAGGAPTPPVPLLPPVLPTISIVLDGDTAAGVDRDAITRALAPAACETIAVTGAATRADTWNQGITRAGGEIVLLWRSGAVPADALLAPLLDELMVSDLVGVLGTTWLAGPTLDWSGADYLHGWSLERRADTTLAASACSLEWPSCRGVHALDGPLLAFRRELAPRLHFDASVLDGEHLIEIDLSYRAYREGLRLAVRSDLPVVCDAARVDAAAMARSASRFMDKFGWKAPFARRGAAVPTAAVADAAQARALFAWLASWCLERERFAWEHLT
jgi:hypothetical protein